MENFLKWQDQLTADAEMYEQQLVNEALTLHRYGQGVKMLKGLKQGLPDSYSGTVDQIIATLMNTVIDKAISDVRKEAMNAEVQHND